MARSREAKQRRECVGRTVDGHAVTYGDGGFGRFDCQPRFLKKRTATMMMITITTISTQFVSVILSTPQPLYHDTKPTGDGTGVKK